VDRTIPTKLNYYISVKYRDEGLPEDTVRLGVTLILEGSANDYTGKGMYGGKIIIRDPEVENTNENVIVGNTVLYGATGGEFYAAGRAGERFAIRNSGAAITWERV